MKCHKNKHLAMYERLMTFQGSREDSTTEDNPRVNCMTNYYKAMFPNAISRFSISADLDTLLGWRASDLIRGCLEVMVGNRITADRFTSYYELARNEIEEVTLPNETRLLPFIKGRIPKKDIKGKKKKRRNCWEGSPTDDVEADDVEMVDR